MINIDPGEKILKVLRRHWWILAENIIVFLALIIIPILGFAIIKFFIESPLTKPSLDNVYWFIYLAYLLYLFLMFIINLINYYLDFWIITEKRIINVELKNLFNHETSEFTLDKIQDITVEINGVIPSFLNYGNVIVKTASGVTQLNIKQIANPTEIKDIIFEATKTRS